jgi:hypothetical protein
MGWAQLPTRARASTNGMNWLLVNMRCSWSSICGDQPAKWSPTTAARLRSDAAMSTPPQRVGRAIQLGRLPPRDPPGPGVAATVEWVAAAQRREPSGTLSLRTTAQGRGGGGFVRLISLIGHSGRGGGADPPALCASNLVCGCRPQRGYDIGPTATGAPNYAPKSSAMSADVRWCSLMCVVVLYSDPCCAGPLSNRWQPA